MIHAKKFLELSFGSRTFFGSYNVDHFHKVCADLHSTRRKIVFGNKIRETNPTKNGIVFEG